MAQEAVSVVTQEEPRLPPSNVVYLIGSGLTNATAFRVKHGSEMVMNALFGEIVPKLRDDDKIAKDPITGPLINRLSELSESQSAPNLEELIDLLESSGREACIRMSEKLSSTFADVLLNHVKRLINDLPENLAEVLLDLHSRSDSPEKLVGIITTNYDTLIEIAIQSIGYYINYGFETRFNEGKSIVLLKLHGSIDWEQSVPIGLRELSDIKTGEGRAWIGPRRLKVASQYPFDLIWGKARELLCKADTIRIIGCSLLPSDWHIAQLLFRTSILDSQGRHRKIEIVNRGKECERIQNAYPMLDLVPIYRIDEVVRNVRAGDGKPWGDPIGLEHIQKAKDFLWDSKNPVEYWLQSEVQMLLNNRMSIDTEKGRLRAFADNRSST